mgnify:CR=1 FL=1
MKICLLGNNLTNLVLANILLKKKINVDIIYQAKSPSIRNTIRTIAISNENYKFLKENIKGISNFGWPTKKIKIYSTKNKSSELFEFENKNQSNFFLLKYSQLYNLVKKNKFLKFISLKNYNLNIIKKPDLHSVGCAGKITSFNETDDGRYLIVLNGVCRFKIMGEVNTDNLYRECKVEYDDFSGDLIEKTNEIKFTDLKLIFKNLRGLFKKQGYEINWKEIEKQSLDQTINTLSMASPFSLEEKQVLLESKDLHLRKEKLEEILNTYILDNFNNKTLQ